MKDAGTLKRELVITSPQQSEVTIQDNSKPMYNFCANNYLGLSNDKGLIEAAKKVLDTHGLGLSSVRFICGTQDIHKKLEQTITNFYGTEDTILFPSAFDANAGIFEAILTAEDAVISDELNHASIIDGIRLCKAQRHRFKHMDLGDLERILQETQSARQRLIVTDGVFSMDGHVADLKAICDLATKYNALVFVDDAHATGFMGKTGRGTPEHCGVADRVDIINSTLGKAMGGASGGYTTGPKAVIDVLRNKARPYLFSNSVAPPLVAAAIAAFEKIAHDTTLRDKLENNTKLFVSLMTQAGFDCGKGDHPIVPIMLGDAKLAGEFAKEMVKEGIYVVAFSYPVVPMGKARIRTQISAAHDEKAIKTAVDAFIRVRERLAKK
jgi:glycine C-acetyltransferase